MYNDGEYDIKLTKPVRQLHFHFEFFKIEFIIFIFLFCAYTITRIEIINYDIRAHDAKFVETIVRIFIVFNMIHVSRSQNNYFKKNSLLMSNVAFVYYLELYLNPLETSNITPNKVLL